MAKKVNASTITQGVKKKVNQSSEEQLRLHIMNYSDGFILELKIGNSTWFFKLLLDADNQRIEGIMRKGFENMRFSLDEENAGIITPLLQKGHEILEQGEKVYLNGRARLGIKIIRVVSPEMLIYYCENTKTAEYLVEQFMTDQL